MSCNLFWKHSRVKEMQIPPEHIECVHKMEVIKNSKGMGRASNHGTHQDTIIVERHQDGQITELSGIMFKKAADVIMSRYAEWYQRVQKGELFVGEYSKGDTVLASNSRYVVQGKLLSTIPADAYPDFEDLRGVEYPDQHYQVSQYDRLVILDTSGIRRVVTVGADCMVFRVKEEATV